MKLFPWVGLFLVFTAFPGASYSSTAQTGQSTAQADFRSGIAAFQDGNIHKARALLEQAREAGLRSSALLYNLGVVYFQLGLLDEAEAAFTGLLDTPHAPLARYNLGLVLQNQGDREGARAWFVQAANESSPDEIQALAQQQLASAVSITSTGPFQSALSTQYVGFLSLAAGYDDNIASTPNSATTDEAGAFGDLLASGRVYFNQTSGSALRLDAVAYTRQYPGNAEFDNAYLSSGASWQHPLESARLRSGINLSGFWYGADLLERQVRLDTSYERTGCFLPGIVEIDCEIQIFAAKIQGGSGFSGYDGESWGGELGVEKNTVRWNFSTSYRLDVDRRDDLATETEFFSLSPTRHKVSFIAERRLTNRFSLGAEQSFRLSRYDDPHRLLDNGQVRTGTREDEQFRSLLFAGYQLDRRWRLGMELGWTNNRSSLERYQYQQTEFLISLDGVF